MRSKAKRLAGADNPIAAMVALMQYQEASDPLRARLGQMVTALGGVLPDSSAG